MNKEEALEVQKFLDRYPAEVDWSYDAEFSEEQIEALLHKKDGRFEVEGDMWMDNDYYLCELEFYAYKYALEQLDLLPEDADDDTICKMRDELNEDHGVYVSIDFRLDKLARQTRAYFAVALPIEHDAYWEDYADVRDELEFFGIDPAELREWYPNVRWYACPTRKNPLIKVKDLVDGWINCFYGGYWYVMLEAESVLELALKGELDGKLTVEKGANLIIHDYFNGASSMNAFTLREIEIDAKKIFDDGHDRYGIQSCCGFIDEAWSGVVRCQK